MNKITKELFINALKEANIVEGDTLLMHSNVAMLSIWENYKGEEILKVIKDSIYEVYPDHINCFNFESLIKLCNKCDLKELYRTTKFPLDLLLIQGYDYYQNPELKNNIPKIINDFESNFKALGILDSYYENLAEQGLGRWVILYVGNN